MATGGLRLRQNSEPSSAVVIDSPDHASTLLSQLSLLRTDRASSDTVLVAGNTEVLCHRAVLAASSPYFRAMFHSTLRESREQRIKLDGVTALALKRLVDYIYTGRIEVTVDDAQDLLAAASLFQYAEVVNTCCRFLLTHLHPSNCLGVEAFGHHHTCSQLAAEAHRFALENFEVVASESDEFLELSAQRLESYVSSDDIEVRMEESVFEAVVRWIAADVNSRRSAACGLLGHVRFPSIASSYVESTVRPHHHVADCARCLALVSTGTSQALGARPSTIAREVMVVVGGRDRSGDVLTSVEAYSPLKRCWKQLPDVPVAVQHCSVTAVNDDIFVCGGVVDGRTVAAVWRFMSVTRQWLPGPAMLQSRAHHSSAALGRRLYVVGGTRDAAAVESAPLIGSIECLEVGDAAAWRVVATVPCPRLGSHAAAYGDRSLVEVGGLQAGGGVVSTVELYSCDGRQLVYSGEQFVLPEPIRRARVAAAGDVLYVLWTDCRRVISLNVERRIFRRLSDLRRVHAGGATTVLGGRVYMTGGSEGGGGAGDVVCSAVEDYDAEVDEWSDVTPMSHARTCHGCVTIRMR